MSELKFNRTHIEDLIIVERTPFSDSRGTFIKLFAESFNLPDFNRCVESNVVKNTGKGTVRGMHYQKGLSAESKLVSVISGSIIDVVVDLRKTSNTFGEIFAVELNSQNNLSLLIPKGFAHGYQTLENETILSYYVDYRYEPKSEFGINPLSLEIANHWILPISAVSEKDMCWPNYSETFI